MKTGNRLSPTQPRSTASTLNPTTNTITISQLNCRSVLNKLWYIEHMLPTWNSDILFLSETWLRPHTTTSTHLALPNFSLHRRDRPHREHGGLLVYTSSDLCAIHRPDLEHPDIECITIQITLQRNTKHFLFACYRPPAQPPDMFFNHLSGLLDAASKESPHLTILGDFNAKHTSWDYQTNYAGNLLFQLMLDFGLSQCVDTPTRYSDDLHSCSTIDLYATTRPDLITDVNVSDPISDHCCVSVSIAHPSTASSDKAVTFVDFAHADWSGMLGALSRAPLFAAIQGTTNIDVAWRVWYDLCSETIRPFVPTRTVRLHSKKKGWMTPNLRRLCTKKRRLFNAARRSRSDQTWTQYKQIRNQCTTAINKAKSEYFEQKEVDLASEIDGSHRWWQKAKALAKISSPKDVIPELACPDSGERASSDTKKANLLADFFAKQCTDRPAGDSGFANAAPGAPYPLPDGAATFTFPPISESLVLRKLLRLRPSKATADSLFCNRFLQKCAPFLATSITFLFNLSLSTSSFPSAWKYAKVIPLYKHRGSRADPSNYRPISLLPAIGKVMDDIQSSRLLDFMTSNKLISMHQFGFVPRKSTVQQLVYIVHKWAHTRDNKGQFSATFMDFMKAFDRVWHDGLLHKLAQCGVSLSSLAWICNYLSGRHITVRVGEGQSVPQPISAGVPQGSHLGPVLFVIFINDLPCNINRVHTELYADDALLHQAHQHNQEVSLSPLQEAVTSAENWAISWRGRFGHAKTKMMSSSTNIQTGMLRIENKAIDIVPCTKHLGVVLSRNLDWHDHIHELLLKAAPRAGLLRWMSKVLRPATTAQLYLYFLRPKLEYASPVWHGNLLERDAMAIERVQAAVARSILQAPFRTSKTDLFKQLNWPSLRWRREIASMTLFHKLLVTRPPPLDSCLFPFASTLSGRSMRKPHQLILPEAHTSKYINSFFYRSSLVWNTLPAAIQNITCNQTFKKKIEKNWSAHMHSTQFNPI